MKIILFIFLFFISYCSGVDFVYKDNQNLSNPLYGKTKINTQAKTLIFMNSYVPMFFGKSNNEEFFLSINIEEKKTKRSVETNQALHQILRYELRFFYFIKSNEKRLCYFEKEILSYFSIIPKSSGYNYGTDVSLEKKYELAITDNLNRFVINYLSDEMLITVYENKPLDILIK